MIQILPGEKFLKCLGHSPRIFQARIFLLTVNKDGWDGFTIYYYSIIRYTISRYTKASAILIAYLAPIRLYIYTPVAMLPASNIIYILRSLPTVARSIYNI